MILMIIYTKIDFARKYAAENGAAEVANETAASPNSLLLTGKLEDALGGTMEETYEASEEESQEKEDILGPAEKINLKTARKEPHGLAVELDYVSADRISLHGAFGYMAYSLSTGEDGVLTANQECAVTLEELGGISMGGAAYTDVIGGDGCALIIPGIHNKEIARRRRFLYIEETNEIAGGVVAPEWMMEKASNYDYSDSIVENEYASELAALLRTEYEGKLLYGPAVVPEYNSNVYGFLADHGDNLEDVWYGLWNRDLGQITKILLFEESGE